MSFRAQGMRAWLLQRLTAVYIGVFLLFLISWITLNFPLSFISWKAFIISPVMLIATMIFYLSLLIHAWVGVRDILVDYAKPSSLRFVLLTALALFLCSMTAWLALIIISMVKI